MWSNGDGYEALNKHYWQMKKDHIGGIEIETGFSFWDGYHGDHEKSVLGAKGTNKELWYAYKCSEEEKKMWGC